jgi:hypothetical protein
MNRPIVPRRVNCLLSIAMCVFLSSGCTSPPSVAPLLRVSERALLREADQQAIDAERDAEQLRQTRRSLEQAYNRDLTQTPELTAQWVREATQVYVSAREALVRHENALSLERQTRVENLKAAASATRRAIGLLEQQDKLLAGAMGEDLRRILNSNPYTRSEPRR